MALDNLPEIDLEEESMRARRPLDSRDGFAGAAGAPKHAAPAPGYAAPAVKRTSRVKYVAVAAVALLAVAGAGAAFAAVMGQKATEEPVAPTTSVETVKATVKANDVLVDGPELKRGDTLSNVSPATGLSGSYADDYYCAEYNGEVVYVKKSAVRTADEAAPEQWVGYAAADAIIYARPDFAGDDILTLELNAEVTVLDAFGDLLFVRSAEGYEGYMPADKVSREPVEEIVEDVPITSDTYGSAPSSSGDDTWYGGGSSWSGGGSGSSGSSGDSGGSSSGSNPSTPSTGGNAQSGDGEEMQLPVGFVPSDDPFLFGVGVAYADEVESSGAESAGEGLTAVVLADLTPTYTGIFNRGDEVTVKVDDLFDFTADEASDSADASSSSASAAASSSDAEAAEPLGSSEERELEPTAQEGEENLCTIIVDEREVTLPEEVLRLESEPAYDEWTAYATEGAALYADYRLTSVDRELAVNDELHVVDAIGSVLVVEIDGSILYVDEVAVSADPIEVVQEEEVVAETDTGSSYVDNSYSYGGGTWSYSSGGGSGSGSGGSGASGGSESGSSSGAGGGASEPSSGSDEVWTPEAL